jgi:hypothetical protein
MKLLTRDEFRNAVFARDKNLCVICKEKGQDAHHILERRLFGNGGYFLDNGATLCGIHHILAEQTILTCEEIRQAAGILLAVLPDHLYPDDRYDKWGNIILPNGTRLKGELFEDESVQKIIAPVINQFSKYVKYPRTYHLPWLPGATKDDRILENTSNFASKNVVITVKMDGENTTLYNDYLHVRSLESKSDATRHWMQNYHAKLAWEIKDGWRFCGENLYAKHNISYQDLPSYFQLFSIWDENNYCMSWQDTKEYAAILDINLVPVLYEGIYDEKLTRNLYKPMYDGNEMEGFVIRLADKFHYKDFRKSVAKYVREGHVAGSHNYRRSQIVLNELAK